MGALTHFPSSTDDIVQSLEEKATNLAIPNSLARWEFIEEISRNDLVKLKEGFLLLVEKQDISLFVSTLENSFRGFKGQNAIDSEPLFSAGNQLYFHFFFGFNFINILLGWFMTMDGC